MSWLEDPIKLVSAIVAMAGVALAWWRFREESLRRSEVLDWANQSIACLESLVIACILLPKAEDLESGIKVREGCNSRILDAAFDSAVLVERGRIFFKNQLR